MTESPYADLIARLRSRGEKAKAATLEWQKLYPQAAPLSLADAELDIASADAIEALDRERQHEMSLIAELTARAEAAEAALTRAREEEREACAKIADVLSETNAWVRPEDVAAAIRARKTG